MTINYKKTISLLLVFVLAVVTGFAIGKIYLDGNKGGEDSPYTYAELALPDSEIKALYNKSLTSSVENFTAMQLWQIADYKLSQMDYFKKVMLGNVNSTGQNLILKAEKVKENNLYTYTKLSPSKTVVGIKTPEVCSQIIYDYSTKLTTINKGKITKNGPTANDLEAEFSSSGSTKYREQEYIEIFKGLPQQSAMPYIFTSKSAKESYFSAVTKNDDGSYTFKIELKKEELRDPTTCYTREIYFSCGYGNPSLTWDNVAITVTINPDFTFKNVVYYEKYQIKGDGLPIGTATIIDNFSETFEYEEAENE